MLVRNGDMTSGQLVSFLLYLQSLSDAFATIGYVFSSLTQAVGAADKVFELLHRKPKMKVPTNAVDEAPAEHPTHTGILGIEATKTRLQRSLGRRPARDQAIGSISLQDIVMYYPARPKRKVLDGLSLRIEPGSVVALVGQSGGGKSSVMSLIQHLYEPSSGRVLIDGHDVHELCPEWLSRHISIVSQEPTLFARSIKKNIMYGLEGTPYEPTDDEIQEAARLANAHSFIMDMPQQYDTEAGERGVQLSGGQKQR
jgi:ATP-binding cassette, subfamily B (MDR/TAP), member 9